MVVTQNESCTFIKAYVNFSRFGSSSCIFSTQIKLFCFTGRLKSTVIPPCEADLFVFAQHKIRYVLAVGPKLFGCLAGRKEEYISKVDLTVLIRKYVVSWQVLRNLSYLCTFQNKCMFMRLVMWSLENFIHQSRYPEGAEIKKDGCQLFSFTYLLTFRNFFVEEATGGAELQTSIQYKLLG